MLANIGIDAAPRQDGDYIDADGLLHCGTCREPKEAVLTMPDWMRDSFGNTIKRPRMCACQFARYAADAAQRETRAHIQRVAELRAIGVPDARLRECTFDADDRQDAKTRAMCLRYIDRWERVRADRIGLNLWGTTGCGKTFYAACIANALIEREIGALLTTIPDLSARMSANYGEARGAVLDEVRRTPLLILDDVGFERTTSTGLENAFAIVDARYDSGKPLIVTTNLTPEEMDNPPDVAHKRALSRIAEMCAVPVHVEGSRREGIAKARRDKAIDALLGDE